MQNDCFIVFLWLIQRCIVSLAYLIIGKAFLSIDFSVKKWLIGSGMISVRLLVDYLFGMKLHIIFLLLELVLFSHYIYSQLWKKTWQGTTVLLVISEISELILLFAYDLLFSAEEKSAFNNLELISFPTLKLNLFAALILLILAYACLLVKKILPKLSLLFVIRIPLWLRLCLAAAEIVFLGLWYWRVSDKNIYGGSEGFLVIIFTFLAFFTLLVGLARDIAQYNLEKRNRALGATQQSIAAFLFEMRAFRHDIANILYGWQGAVMEGDIEKIRAYNSEMSSMFSLINNDNTLNLQKLGSGSIRKLLNEKLHLAEQSGVPTYLLVEGVFDHFRMRESDLCRVLGILTDNAIQAASDCSCPTVHIHVYKETGVIHFLVRNTAKDDLIDLISRGDSEAETEDSMMSSHGIGLKSAQDIMTRYSKADLFLYTRGRYVEACLSIPA